MHNSTCRATGASSFFFFQPGGFLAAFCLLLVSLHATAQPCRNAIGNNSIRIQPAVCANTVAILQGSVPTGGNGSFIYQWEFSAGNCGENNFRPIQGANDKDYVIPANANPNTCYRRVVISGNCMNRSNKTKVEGHERTDPKAPEVRVEQPGCQDPEGSITVTSPAPAAGISYSIDGRDYSNTTGKFSNLSPGTYRVSAKHSSGCISPVQEVIIEESSELTGSITPATATLCPGGTLTLTVSGGTSYQWYRNGEKIDGATHASYETRQAGDYTADILTEACRGKATNTAVVKLSSPITFEIVTKDPNCTDPGGSITIASIAGGSGNGYQYSNNNGATYQTGNSFTDLPAGNYTIIVKDRSGCESEGKVAVIHSFVSALKITTTVTNIACNQRLGTITASASGGTMPYRFRINGGNAQTLNIFTGLAAGSYTVTVEDAAGCRSETKAAIGIINSTLAAKAIVTSATCTKKGSVTIEATGGTPPYQYRLDGGAFQSSATFTDLTSGSRKVTVKDSLGCEFEVGFEMRENTGSPNLVIHNPPRVCPGTTANLLDSSVFRGSDPALVFTYWRDSGATLALANPGAVTPGTYYIKAVGNAGCATVRPVVVTAHTVPIGNITVQGPPFACNGRSITLSASTGDAYQWYRNDTAIDGATERTYHATVSGVYAVDIVNDSCTVRALNPARIQFQDCITTPETNVFVPTAFTPNRNGENDVLRPILYNIASLSYFKVYNRWGQLVFETAEAGKGWDGNIKGAPQPTETYSWILQCTDNNGNVIKKSGRSVLIR